MGDGIYLYIRSINDLTQSSDEQKEKLWSLIKKDLESSDPKDTSLGSPSGNELISNAYKLHQVLGDEFISYLEKAVRIDLDPLKKIGINNTDTISRLGYSSDCGHSTDQRITGLETLWRLDDVLSVLGKDKMREIFIPLLDTLKKVSIADKIYNIPSLELNGERFPYQYSYGGHFGTDAALLPQIGTLLKFLSAEELKPAIEKMLELSAERKNQSNRNIGSPNTILESDLSGLVNVLGDDTAKPMILDVIRRADYQKIDSEKIIEINNVLGDEGISAIKQRSDYKEIISLILSHELGITNEGSNAKTGKFNSISTFYKFESGKAMANALSKSMGEKDNEQCILEPLKALGILESGIVSVGNAIVSNEKSKRHEETVPDVPRYQRCKASRLVKVELQSDLYGYMNDHLDKLSKIAQR